MQRAKLRRVNFRSQVLPHMPSIRHWRQRSRAQQMRLQNGVDLPAAQDGLPVLRRGVLAKIERVRHGIVQRRIGRKVNNVQVKSARAGSLERR